MEYQFKVGDKGFTRSKQPYRILATDVVGQARPILALVTNKFGVEVVGYSYSSGQMYDDSYQHEEDLIPPTPTVEYRRFFNCYVEGNLVYGYDTLEQARAGRVTLHGEESSNVIGTIEVQVMSYGPPNLIFHEKKE